MRIHTEFRAVVEEGDNMIDGEKMMRELGSTGCGEECRDVAAVRV